MRAVRSWKIFLRWLLATLIYYGRLPFLWRVGGRRRQPIVLAYHRILNPMQVRDRILPGMYVRPRTFEKHLRYLKRHYRVVTMREFLSGYRESGMNHRPLCAITFDDGWDDNYSNALPALRSHQLPATLFVSTDFIDTGGTPWFYHLSCLLERIATRPRAGGAMGQFADCSRFPRPLRDWLQAPPDRQRQGIYPLIDALKRESGDTLNAILRSLDRLLPPAESGACSPPRAMLTWTQLREMASSRIEIGSHGCSHMILGRIPPAAVQAEVTESKRSLESQLRHTVEGFSYPNGDHSDRIRSLVRTAGYTYACSLDPGPVLPDDLPYQVKRILVHEDITFTTAMFACHIEGIFRRTSRSDPQSHLD